MSKPVINCKFTGPRLGNQLFGYAFARGYAEKHGCELRCDPWLGSRLFQLDDKLPSAELPIRSDVEAERWQGETNIAIRGYSMRQACLTYTRSQAKQWFQFRPEIASHLKTVPIHDVCAHVRHGDFVGLPGFVAISMESYTSACEQFGFDPKSIHFVSQESPNKIAPLEKLELGFVADFYQLIRARILFRANSTFSWWAATLGSAEHIFSPDLRSVLAGLTELQFTPFVEGNWPSMSNSHSFVEDLHLPP